MAAMQLAFDLATKSDTVTHLAPKPETVSVLPDLVTGGTPAVPVGAPAAAESANVPAAPSKRTQAQETGITCPLCGGRLIGNVCEKCGMEVLR